MKAFEAKAAADAAKKAAEKAEEEGEDVTWQESWEAHHVGFSGIGSSCLVGFVVVVLDEHLAFISKRAGGPSMYPT